jgi:hypothetical protein
MGGGEDTLPGAAVAWPPGHECPGGFPRLSYWSNPNNLYNCRPMGTTTKNHNARVLNDTRATVAAFR